jgi:hypothetical protein
MNGSIMQPTMKSGHLLANLIAKEQRDKNSTQTSFRSLIIKAEAIKCKWLLLFLMIFENTL